MPPLPPLCNPLAPTGTRAAPARMSQACRHPCPGMSENSGLGPRMGLGPRLARVSLDFPMDKAWQGIQGGARLGQPFPCTVLSLVPYPHAQSCLCWHQAVPSTFPASLPPNCPGHLGLGGHILKLIWRNSGNLQASSHRTTATPQLGGVHSVPTPSRWTPGVLSPPLSPLPPISSNFFLSGHLYPRIG